jgi:hypothetical protein
MPPRALLQTRVDPGTAALVRYHADRAKTSTSEWIAGVLRREISRAGAADALAPRGFETLVTVGYMLRSLMIDAMGAEAAETAIQDAAASAAEETASEMRRAGEVS